MPEAEKGNVDFEVEDLDGGYDYEALYRLSLNPDFQALVAVFRVKIRAARRHLDDRKTDNWQDVGFYRSHIYLLRTIYKLVTRTAKEEITKKKIGGK